MPITPPDLDTYCQIRDKLRQMFVTKEAIRTWMDTPNPGLDNDTPMGAIVRSGGPQRILTLLNAGG